MFVLVEFQQIDAPVSYFIAFGLFAPGHPYLEVIQEFIWGGAPDVIYLNINRSDVPLRPIDEVSCAASPGEDGESQD